MLLFALLSFCILRLSLSFHPQQNVSPIEGPPPGHADRFREPPSYRITNVDRLFINRQKNTNKTQGYSNFSVTEKGFSSNDTISIMRQRLIEIKMEDLYERDGEEDDTDDNDKGSFSYSLVARNSGQSHLKNFYFKYILILVVAFIVL